MFSVGFESNATHTLSIRSICGGDVFSVPVGMIGRRQSELQVVHIGGGEAILHSRGLLQVVQPFCCQLLGGRLELARRLQWAVGIPPLQLEVAGPLVPVPRHLLAVPGHHLHNELTALGADDWKISVHFTRDAFQHD